MGRKKIRRGPGQQEINGKDFRLAEEVRYIQRRAAAYDARFVTVGTLALFSTDTGDAWLLDPGDHLAARIARDGAAEPIPLEETETSFAIEWKGNYRIDGLLCLHRPEHLPGRERSRVSDGSNCEVGLI